MIALGSCDPTVPDSARSAYLQQLQSLTRLAITDVSAGVDRIAFAPFTPTPDQPLTVAQVQGALKTLGFFPGGNVDGICGYRTQSAIRLFQEYVRTVEGHADVTPDGRVGPSTQGHLKRWLDGTLTTSWAPAIAAWKGATFGTAATGEYDQWIAFLEQVKTKQRATPSVGVQKVNASKPSSDSRKVSDWDFSPRHVHLVGIRREEASGKFDDIFVLLLKGLTFKFQGSTEPGASDNPLGRPYLVPGQHDYHFGWHKRTYLALRPNGPGVLVVRSREGGVPTAADWARDLEVNATINIHWGGKGLTADVKTWSEGCQVINGSLYLDPTGKLVSCAAFAAVNNTELNGNASKTRGAYNVLLDLVTALGSDLPPVVKYVLVEEGDLALAPALGGALAKVRGEVGKALG